ncbi:unnamed protein product [Rodentolepis nana]|uniref:MARVEL domain-containing protein n=1 Tax=Rodentolepis nana TaxID=102285 RepID=A0A0R3TPH2_RODNA|nr:unnamed protein product [Rodentolepis nana]
MNRLVGLIFLSFVASILIFLAVGYRGWSCNDAILGPLCYSDNVYYTIGILLICVGLLAFFMAILFIHYLVEGFNWSIYVAMFCSSVAVILGLAAVVYFIYNKDYACPYIAALGVGMAAGLFTLLSFENSE